MRWFKHMTASANDEKLSRLRDEFGLAGYGFWWSVVEIIAGNLSEDEQTSVTFSPKKWGNSLGISPKKFRTLAEFCAKIELFQMNFSQNAITINMPNILKYKDEYTGKRTKKSGQTPDKCRDNVRPSRARVTETDTEYIPPLPPQGGNADTHLPEPVVDWGDILPEPAAATSPASNPAVGGWEKESPPGGEEFPPPAKDATERKRKRKTFCPPSVPEVAEYCRERANGIDPAAFVDHYSANGWRVGKSAMVDWKAAVRTWEHTRKAQQPEPPKKPKSLWEQLGQPCN